jgi:acyl-coenzyme A synthetase/AMP-(fatty) acid ligase
MLLIDRVLQAVERNADAPAFIANDRPTSYRAMLALLSNTIRNLHERGVRPGQVVALTLPQTPLHVITFLALARLGAISVPVFPIADAGARAELYRRFDIEAVVTDREDCGAPGVALILLRTVSARGDETELGQGGFTPVGETPLRIGLTSGTAGTPKGILHTHDMYVRRLDRRFYGDALRPRVIPPSLSITASMQLACHALCSGGTVVFPTGYDGVNLLAAIRRHGVTHVTMPPVNLAPMLGLLEGDTPAFPSITHLRLMGTTPSPAFVELARRKFSPNIYAPYSTMEVGVIALATPETLAIAPRSSGRVAPGARLEVIGEDGRVLPPGQSGEIRVAVEGMPTGYVGRDVDNSRFRDGWFHPQDRGYISSEGFVFVEGRIDEIINVGGRKLAPKYAESVLQDHPSVREAAVFAFEPGVESVHIAAAIVPAGPLDWNALDQYARATLEFLAPRRYYEVDHIPRNARGKILRQELENMVRDIPAKHTR